MIFIEVMDSSHGELPANAGVDTNEISFDIATSMDVKEDADFDDEDVPVPSMQQEDSGSDEFDCEPSKNADINSDDNIDAEEFKAQADEAYRWMLTVMRKVTSEEAGYSPACTRALLDKHQELETELDKYITVVEDLQKQAAKIDKEDVDCQIRMTAIENHYDELKALAGMKREQLLERLDSYLEEAAEDMAAATIMDAIEEVKAMHARAHRHSTENDSAAETDSPEEQLLEEEEEDEEEEEEDEEDEDEEEEEEGEERGRNGELDKSSSDNEDPERSYLPAEPSACNGDAGRVADTAAQGGAVAQCAPAAELSSAISAQSKPETRSGSGKRTVSWGGEEDIVGPEDLTVDISADENQAIAQEPKLLPEDNSKCKDEFDFDLPEPQKSHTAPVAAETCQDPPKLLPDSSCQDDSLDDMKKEDEKSNLNGLIDQQHNASGDVHVESVVCEESEACQGSDACEKSGARLAAEAEWAAVETVTPEIGDGSSKKPEVRGSRLVMYDEAMEHCRATNFDHYKPDVRTTVHRRGFSAFVHAMLGCKMSKTLQHDRELVFLIAACPFQNDDLIHNQVLQTLYRRLTGSKFDCPRFGSHWEQIGFQGNDPATDLRACGFFGLLQLLYMVTDPTLFALTKDIYRLSLHETQNFPFCVMGINMTRVAIQTLREDCLNKECNKRKDVFQVVNDFFAGLYLSLYTTWKNQGKTIKDTGFVMKDLESLARKKPSVLLKGLAAHLNQRRQKEGATASGVEPAVDFQAVCDKDED